MQNKANNTLNKNKLGRYFCLILLLNITIASLPFSALVLADTPTETILLDDGFEGVDWDANWDNIASSWYRSTYRHSGSYAAAAMSGRAGAFTTDALDASDAQAIHVEFWFMKYLTDATDYTLFYYDGTSYVHIDELENNGGDYPAWVHYTDTITDSRFFVSNFRIRVYLTADSSQQGWIDDVLITKDIRLPQYTLSVNTVGQGQVTVNPDQSSYDSGTVVTLTAVPSSGWEFQGWSGAVSGSANPTSVTMNSDKFRDS